MTSEDNIRRWKQEAETLKQDLANRAKEVVKRDVPIRLKPKEKSNRTIPSSSTTNPDDWTRQQLGL